MRVMSVYFNSILNMKINLLKREGRKVDTKTGFSEQIYWYAKNIVCLISNLCFLPFYLSTSSHPSQSSVVFFLEVESCFYLVILVSFSTSEA